jgi:hypothetical protein
MIRQERAVVPGIGFLLFFVGLWCLTCALLARVGGWSVLARSYRALGKPDGRQFAMQSARFGWVDYSRCLTVRVAASGLYVVVWPLFRVGHPPLLIPWAVLCVLAVREGWWRSDVTLAVGAPELARIRLPLKVVAAAEGLRGEPFRGE